MTQRSRTLTRACAAMLLTVFMAYYAIISVYAHVHVVNGVMVVHSHPFKDKHSHPTGQTLVLHHLTHFNSLEAGPAAEIEAPRREAYSHKLQRICSGTRHARLQFGHISARASRFFIFINHFIPKSAVGIRLDFCFALG